jgi:hypothetical protein
MIAAGATAWGDFVDPGDSLEWKLTVIYSAMAKAYRSGFLPSPTPRKLPMALDAVLSLRNAPERHNR